MPPAASHLVLIPDRGRVSALGVADIEMSSRRSLLRVLGLAFGISTVVGGMVGQGILRAPGVIAGAVHSPELILALWIVGALLAGITAFAYVELGTAIPCAGGAYDFVRRAFGPLLGVVAGWGVWLVMVTVEAFLAIVVAEFLHRLGVFSGWPRRSWRSA